MPAPELEAIVADPALDTRQTLERVAALLRREPDRGVASGIEAVVGGDESLTSFTAGYLALLPGARDQQREALRRVLRDRPDRLQYAADLVRYADRDLAAEVVRQCLAEPDVSEEPLLYATEAFPDVVRERTGAAPVPVGDDIGLWPGAPDSWVDEALRHWPSGPGAAILHRIGVTRTDTARQRLVGLRDEVPAELRDVYALRLENAGVAPDVGGPVPVYPRTLLGLVTDRDASPHAMGAGVGHDVPLCPMCDEPAERILTLDRAALPFDVAGVADPSFFRFLCDCDVLPYLYVRLTDDGIEPIMAEAGPSSAEGGLPGRLALELSEHPNQFGSAYDSVPGFTGHQVGGYPPWVDADRFPYCAECRRSMRFLACVDGGMTVFGPMPFDGTVFGFWCERCSISVTVEQRLDR